MSQSKRQSMVEVWANTSIGVFGSWIITMICLHYIDNKVYAGTITVIACTVWSLIRGYAVRRYFNGKRSSD